VAGLGKPVQAKSIEGFVLQSLDGNGSVAERGVVVKIACLITAFWVVPFVVLAASQQGLRKADHLSKKCTNDDFFRKIHLSPP
jgi:hypothetical protein